MVSQEIILLFQEKLRPDYLPRSQSKIRASTNLLFSSPSERALGIASQHGTSFFLKGNLEGQLEWLNTCFQTKDHSS
ncbi:MAG: hypothetical protein IPN76_34660 [Saprospiraceae bacterium]|nr:hypothetical protein [Saprospiraceae bacterium]